MEFNGIIKYIKDKHDGQKRKQGTPYYLHPLQVSIILKEKGFSIEYQIAGLMHDLLEDTDTTYEEILKLTNEKIARTVKLLTKEPGYIMLEYMQRIYGDHMARMVKLADRVHNLSEVHLASTKFQEKYIKETQIWYTGLAKGTVFEKDIKEAIAQYKKNQEPEL